ncbi:MAG: class I SAM-dependent methyltransferase, partial [Alphaproteobacteria bacterium]|nr:class I SAM-dependent methyltransferase [Alphaproteobacteria bacterium]
VSHNIVPRSVCDVGCGAGEVLVQLQKRMDKATRFFGFDTAQTAIDLCKPKENPGLKFQKGDFLADSRDRYDLILALDVFEHVPDYLGFLAKLSKRADKFVFHIPLDINASTVLLGSRYMMYMRKNYGHLHFFTAESALATLEEGGYSVLDYKYTWDREREVYPRMPKSLLGKLKCTIEWAILTVEQFGNRLSPRFWSRIRKQYNLLVIAEPARGNVEP